MHIKTKIIPERLREALTRILKNPVKAQAVKQVLENEKATTVGEDKKAA